MTQHRIEIGVMATRVKGAEGAAADWQGRMARVMLGPAPRAFAVAADAILGKHAGVIRLRRLQVRFAPDGGLATAGFADALGGQMARALATAFRTADAANLRTWADRESYAASYAMMRLGLAPEPRWAFPDFDALIHLGAEDASAAVLSPLGPSVWPVLSLTGIAIPRIVESLPDTVLAQFLSSVDYPVLTAIDLDTAFSALLDNGFEQSLSLEKCIALALIQAARGLDRVDISDRRRRAATLAGAVIALATMRRLRDSGLTVRDIAAVAGGQHPPPANVPRFAIAVLGGVFAVPSGWHSLVRMTADATSRPNRSGKLGKPQTVPDALSVDALRHVSSLFAGLALALPLFGPLPNFSPQVRRAIALRLLDDELSDALDRDPGFNLLFGADPRGSVSMIDAPDQALWLGQGTLAGAVSRDGAAAWADLILARLAARLPGLSQSSRLYLRRSLLVQPGRIESGADTVTVTLAPMPLGIVARMSGLIGFAGPLACLSGRSLSIALET